MIRRGFALVASSAFFFLACGGKISSDEGSTAQRRGGGSGVPTDGTCPAAGAKFCSADDPISDEDVAQCQKSLGDATCGSAYKFFLACAEQHLACDATNHTDSSKLTTVCNEQVAVYSRCIEPPTPQP